LTVDKQVNRIQAIKALKEAEITKQNGDVDGAIGILSRAMNDLENSKTFDDLYIRNLIDDLASGIRELRNYSSGGYSGYSYQMTSAYVTHNTQRSTYTTTSNTNYHPYETKKKKDKKIRIRIL